MNKYLRSILLALSLLLTQAFVAQKLYWVGGSGNFNDPTHWSQQSGGVGGAKTPTASDDVYFDENSFLNKSIINFIGASEVHDFIFTKYTPAVVFSGLQNEKITINGNVQLNSYIDNQFAGDVWFTSHETNTSVFLGLTKFKNNIYFNGNTNWQIQGDVRTTDNATTFFKQGFFNLNNAAIYSGNLIANPQITINSNQSTFRITNKFVLSTGVIYNSTKSHIYAHTKDVSKFQIASSITLGANSRLHNLDNVMSCNIFQTDYTAPTCAGACDATVTFSIPVSCSSSSNPVYAMWTSGASPCTTIRTAKLTPGSTYTIGNICGCGTSYQVQFTNDTITTDSTYNITGPQILSGNSIGVTDPQPPQIQNVVASLPPSCFGKCDGAVIMTIKAGTGTPPLKATWTVPSGTQFVHSNLKNVTGNNKDTLKNACAGTYSVFLTDKNGCVSATSTTVLTQPTLVTHTVTPTDELCFGACTGSIKEIMSGGTSPFTFTWSASAAGTTTNTATSSIYAGLCAGTYTVKTKDAHGCKDSAITTITQPTDITFTKNPVSGIFNVPCISACTGNVGVTSVAGGTGAYTYTWLPVGGAPFNGGNSSVYTGLCGSVAGITYTCTIEDANSCKKTATYTVIAPAALSHTIAATNPKCNAGSTGSATVTESGGLAPYTFTWTPAGTVSGVSPKSINSNIPAGTYTVRVTDFNGCTDLDTVILTPPPVLTASVTTKTNPTCPNLNNGQLCVTASGGTPAFTYSWTPATAGTASCTPSTLISQPYSVTVTDANSCTFTTSVTLVPPPSITVTAGVTQPSCAGLSNGSATLTATGGNGVFTYHWSCTAATTPTIGGMAAGTTCNYTVTDGNNCKQTGSVAFTAVSPVTLSLTSTTLACSGNCNAQISSSVGGGTPGYTYAWSGSGLNPVCATCPGQTNMCAGTYTCVVTDAHGCTKTANTSIAAPTPIVVNFTPISPTCNGLCNGSILAVPSGGTGSPYTTSWAPSPLPAPNASTTLHPINLCANTYSLQVVDGNGCTVIDTVSLINPAPIAISLTTTSITCAGQNNGTASVTPSGGTPTYSCSWDNGAFGATLSQTNLTPGTHTVTVKDSKGCSTSQIFIINQPTNLTATATNVVNTCNGLCNGGATANVTGGTLGYVYSWDNAGGPFSAVATSVSGLCAGTHTLYVQDANGCIASATFTITPVINISISSSSTAVSCHNKCDATATAIASGSANPPYTIQWVGSNTCNNVAASSPCIGINLCGTVTVTATDVNGCSNTSTLSIANPPALTATTNTTSVECFGLCTGTATVTPSGGTPAGSAPLYSISWNPGPLPTGTTQSNLCPGTYTASIVDNNGCVLSQPVIIGVSNQFTVTPTITHPSSCGLSDASINLAISGGTGTYTVNWNTGSTANPLTGIPAGTYTATIKDGNSCDTTLVYAVNDLTGPTTTVTVNTNVTCYGQTDGVATVSGSGNGAITVAWPAPNPTGPSPQTGLNLGGPPANYIVKVTDATGCVTNTTVTVTSPPKIKDNATVIQPSCTGALGSITLFPSGGNGAPYSYNWNGSGFVVGNNSLTGLSAGTYSCIIRDVAGCTSQIYTYTMSTTNTPSVSVVTSSVTCSYSKNGTATASANGGLPAYTYTWTNSSNVIIAQGTNISNLSGLAPDTYTLSMNDANNCNTQATFTISAPAVINSNFVKNNNLCSSGSTGAATVAPTGGTGVGTYTVNWNTAGNPGTYTVGAVNPGSYQVIVYDANFCSDTTGFTITKPTPLTITVGSTDPTCFGLANGSATITSVSGGIPFTASGTAPYTLSWGGISCPTCSVVTNLSSGTTYTAIAADSNGCTISQTVTVTSPTQIVPTFTINPPTCVGYSNGSILSSTTGGTGAYTYQWLPMGTAGNATSAINLSAGNYTLTITDANSCSTTTVIPLTDPNALSLIYSSTPATCNNSNGSIIINSANGTGTVSVKWVNPPSCVSSYTCNSLPAGIYSIKLTDSNNCTDTLLATVTNTGGPTITTTTTDINCYGTCNGAAMIKVTSGATPFTFAWNSPPTAALVVSTDSTSTASGLCDSTYISIVTDGLGCKTITSFKIKEPTEIKDNPNITSATCFGINNGSITSNASGGTAFANGYIYSIDGGGAFGPSVSHTFSNLAAGTHTVSITDSVSCTRDFTYTITPASIISSSISATNATCNGNCNGTATVLNITGGTTPIIITWNDPASQVGNFATNLCAGSYTATLTDASGCMALDTISVVAPSAIIPNTVVTNPACGQCDGNITVTPSGGNGTVYTYTWTSPPSHAPTINNICAGPYQVNIADNLGCTQTFQIPVSNSSAPTFTLASTNVACNTMCSGSATITAISGGIAPYTYSWPNVTPVSTASVASALCADTTSPYFVQVKDNAGCIATQSFVITAPSTFTVDNTNTSPSCAVCNGVITLTVTGASTYTYTWSTGATTPSVAALCAGIYTVVVADNVSGCNITKVIALNNNTGPTLNVMSTPATCFDSCNGTASVTASFGTTPYSYTWSPSGGNGTVASNLCDSTYFILVTDAAGCVQTSQVNITSPTALIASLPTVSPIKCANDCNGAITTVIFGGTPSYTYSWSPSTITGAGGTNLCPGNYSLTVTDANGCSVQEFDTLVNPTPLVTTGTVTPSSCNNTADGAITTITSGGTPTYTYQWSGGSSAQTQNLTNTLAGTYTLVATDAKACTDTTNYTLSSAVTVVVNAGRDTVLCSDSPVVLTGTVTGAASFGWQDITGNPIPPANTLTLSVNPATPTQYILAAVNGLCTDNDTVLVSISALAVANAGASQSVFFGQTATIGGSPPNPMGGTITWMPNTALSDTAASNPIASPTVTTTYTLTVTNALGCAVTDTMIVAVLPPFNINNGFTPNGDGKNDAWVIDEIYKFPNTEIEIYNRWGEQLFYSKGAYTPWNGTYKGSPVPVGTYYYIIRLNDKNYPDHYAGPLTILR